MTIGEYMILLGLDFIHGNAFIYWADSYEPIEDEI